MIKIKCTGTEELPLDKIKEFQGALKKRTKAQKEKLLESLKVYGFSFPFFIWKNEGINWCLDGHGRLEVLNSLLNKDQLPTFPVVYVQAEDEAEAKKKLLQLNSQYGEIDTEGLQEFIDGIDIDMSEFEIPDINLDGLIEPKEEGAIPEVEEGEPICKLGDIWQLGNHRLMCGDSTNGERVDLLMNGEKADMVFTDPPYNVDYEGTAGSIQNDNMRDGAFYDFLLDAFKTMFEHVKEGRGVYVSHAILEGANFINAFKNAGFKLSQILIWVKQSATMSRSDFNWKHEPILYGWKEGQAHYFCNDFTLTTVIDDDIDINALKKDQLLDMIKEIRKGEATTVIREDRPFRNEVHPTMKPIKLIERFVKYSSKQNELVLDLFGGSGSTLIACEKLKRVCYMMELDEKYCDVIIKRWENYTGEKAVKING